MGGEGVSIVIPAYRAEETLDACLQSVFRLSWKGEKEVIVVDDGSPDRTGEIASSYPGVQVLKTGNRGAAGATNLGFQRTRHEFFITLDADAALESDWLEKVLPLFDDPLVGAVGGFPATANQGLWGRLMGYEVESRFRKAPVEVDHLYTMNTAYRRSALEAVGLFNEEMRVGYDNDMSYRLKAAGYRLLLQKDARCRHLWRDDLGGYLKQQYLSAYYRLELLRTFGKATDDISGIGMVSQVPLTLLCLLLSPLFLPLLLLPFLAQAPLTLRLAAEKREPAVLLLPPFLVLRNLVWIGAAFSWTAGRLKGRFCPRDAKEGRPL
jgi:glycosyltransferase involved in cell wall biosynthesis